MARKTNRSTYKWIRILHRDIGFFVIGLTVIYCISGVLLIYRDTNFLRSELQIERTLEAGLSENRLLQTLKLKGAKITGVDEGEIHFSGGTYNKESGEVSYVTKDYSQPFRAFNKIHKAPSQDSRHWFMVLYAVSLLFLALSSFWMYRPGTTYFKRGLIIALAGSMASVVLIIT